MIQRLKSLRRTDRIIISIALSVLIVTGIILSTHAIKRANIKRNLESLSQNTVINSEKLHNKQNRIHGYTQAYDVNNDIHSSFTALKDVKEILQNYPKDYNSAIVQENVYSVGFGFPIYGINVWEDFVANCRMGIPGSMVMVQFSADFAATYYYLEFDGDSYHVVEDRSQDSEDNCSGYSEAFGRYLKVEQYEADAGIAEYAYITDNPDMNYKDYDNYYVKLNTQGTPPPYCFQFYIGVITADIIENNKIKASFDTKISKSEYTGYLDRHPDFGEDNPRKDYDGDGILDRVYRKVYTTDNNTKVAAYLMLGNGQTVLLCDDIWAEDVYTSMIDLTGDEKSDICFIQYSKAIGDEKMEVTVFEYRDGKYAKTKLSDDKSLYYEDGEWCTK